LIMQYVVLGLCLLKDGLYYKPWPNSAQKKKIFLASFVGRIWMK
jgi:hypothetical protein